MKLIYQFLYLIYGYLFFRCFGKVFEEKTNENKEGNCQAGYRRKRTGKLKIGMMKFFALTLYLLARITLTLISSSSIIGCFQNVNFQGFNLVI